MIVLTVLTLIMSGLWTGLGNSLGFEPGSTFHWLGYFCIGSFWGLFAGIKALFD